ncbi:MAG: TonB-dependent receptor [Bacteroidota bacterium]|nr:TonB-dependent receptor [Bacteroidota bacterium]
MKLFLFLIFLITIIPKIYAQDLKEIKITEKYFNLGIQEILNDLETKYPVHFYYKEKWLSKEPQNLEFNQTSLKNVLDQLLIANPQLTFRIYNNYAVILGSPESFKDFSQDYYLVRNIERTNLLPVNEGKIGSTIILGKISDKQVNGKVRISGLVSDGVNGESLPGVVIQIPGLDISTSTNGDGRYTLTVPKGNFLAKISSVGYEASFFNIKILNSDNWNIQLMPEPYELDEVIIRETSDDSNVRNLQTGLVKLTPQNIKLLPTFMGEADVVRALLTLPGVSTVGEGASGFNVRGGNIDQNLILFDESIIFNSSHLLGFFSAFNTDAIEEVNLFKGSIPAQYGGRLSSVLDIKSKRDNYEKLEGTGGIGIVSSRLTLSGPSSKIKPHFY